MNQFDWFKANEFKGVDLDLFPNCCLMCEQSYNIGNKIGAITMCSYKKEEVDELNPIVPPEIGGMVSPTGICKRFKRS